jgi:transcriptional regulator with XRE-family HTH domain
VFAEKAYRTICDEVVRLLREERERRGFSKYFVAQRSGLSEQMIGYVERGLRNPSLETVVRIASALEIDLGSVINRAFKSVSRSKYAPR